MASHQRWYNNLVVCLQVARQGLEVTGLWEEDGRVFITVVVLRILHFFTLAHNFNLNTPKKLHRLN